jgi:hypothetical protein
MIKRRLPSWSLLVLAALLYLGLRLPYLHIQFFNVDEAVSAVVGMAILDGGLPYVEAVDHRGPLTYGFFAVIFSLFGDWNMAAVQGVYTGLHLLMCALLYGIGRRIDQPWTGGWAALMYAVWVWVSPFFEMWPAHTEWLLTLCSVLGYGAYLIAPGRPGQRSWRRSLSLVGIGLLFGLGFLSKQLGALEAGGIGGYLLLELGFRQQNWRGLLTECGLMLVGWLLPLACLIVLYAQADALADLWFFGWEYNIRYYVGPQDWLTRLEYTIKLFPAFFLNKILLASLLGGSLWFFPWREIRQASGSQPADASSGEALGWHWLLPGWWLATWLEAMVGGRAFEHYLIPAIAPMTLLGAWVLMRWQHELHAHKRLWQTTLLAVGLGLLLPILQQWQQYKFMRPTDTSVIEFVDVAAYLKARTAPEDRLFVWGFAPQIYALSERRPASRFNFCTFLVGLVPGVKVAVETAPQYEVPGAWDKLRRDFEAHPPAYVIDATRYRPYFEAYPPERYPLGEWLARDYEVDPDYHFDPEFPYRVWRRKTQGLAPTPQP